jgi:hypothetical protein
MADAVDVIYPDPATQPEDAGSEDEAESALGAEPSADWSFPPPTINDDEDTEQQGMRGGDGQPELGHHHNGRHTQQKQRSDAPRSLREARGRPD